MRVRHLRISSFRGWRDLKLRPGEHALVVGEHRAGRSDLVEALRRVLDPDSTRTPPTEFDVYLAGSGEDSSGEDAAPDDADVDGEEKSADDGDAEIEFRSAEVEVVLSELGEALEQHFFRRLELTLNELGTAFLVVDEFATNGLRQLTE
jgi:predicted ATP-dependent endonuclease of OLD family